MLSDDVHVDDETLALLSLGESAATPQELAHVAGCARCGAEVAALRDVVDLAREVGPAPQLVAPPPAVWDRIAAELDLGERAHAAARAEAAHAPGTLPDAEGTTRPLAAAPVGSDPSPGVDDHASVTRSAEPAGPGSADDAPLATVTPLASRRRVRRAWLAVAAAAGLVVGGAGTSLWWQSRPDASTLLASATLEPLPGWSETGTAQVRTAGDGSRTLVVDLDSAPGNDGFLEVWLLKPDVSGLVSLGTLDGTTGEFTLPPGLDLAEFPVVDVSDEPLDGEPAHSGVSVVRGALDA